MNALDKLISYVSPNRALKRNVAREKMKIMNSGYGNYGASASKKTMKAWRSRGGSAKEDIEDNIHNLRERSRDLYTGVPLATGAIKTMRTNVIGSGLRLNSQIDYEYLGMSAEEADEWETIVEREFALWADSMHCDLQRMNNFYELQQLSFLAQLQSGDVFVSLPMLKRANMPYDIRIHVLEADRICNPQGSQLSIDNTIVNGVEIDKNGEVVAYHIARHHPLSFNYSEQSWTRVEKFGRLTGRPNILHLMETERPEQRRGVPLLAPVIEALKQLGRYTDAELMAAVISGMFTVFIKTDSGDVSGVLGQARNDPYYGDEVEEEEQEAPNYEMGAGAIVGLAENESIETANPGRPNQAFEGFVTAICRQIGAALEIPYELLLKNFTASYSASRGALLEAWKMFRMRRAWLANDFCQPIYEEWLTEAVAKGRIHAPGFFTNPMIKKAYCGAEWNGPSQGQIDPYKEAQAAELRIKLGASTHSKEAVELTGADFYRNARQLKVEKKMLKELEDIMGAVKEMLKGGEKDEQVLDDEHKRNPDK
ncbi:phage portal protein [Niallia taxi]|uniref:phage portal protein n=1 Tax=Niallia taxi TaxID=2499688 RepID=UPI0021A8E732|nr:phage portal protein [Niallia taxi]MCT2347131.1 phage portal protein [Niallia taxi]